MPLFKIAVKKLQLIGEAPFKLEREL